MPPVVLDYGGGSVGEIVCGYALPQREPNVASLRAHRKNDEDRKEVFAVERRRVVNFDALECCIDAALCEGLGWVRGEPGRGVFVVEPLLCGRRERERLCCALFE